jgi:hypothetical protein
MNEDTRRQVGPIIFSRGLVVAALLAVAATVEACAAVDPNPSQTAFPSESAVPVRATSAPSAAASLVGTIPSLPATVSPTQTRLLSPAPTPFDCVPAGTVSPPPSPINADSWEFRGHQIVDDDPRYGGVYIDGNTFVINATGQPELICDEIRSILPAGAQVQIRLVEYPFSELVAVMANVEADWQELTGDGIGINFLDADEVANRVVIGIKPFSDELAGDLRTRYGRTIKVIEKGPATY